MRTLKRHKGKTRGKFLTRLISMMMVMFLILVYPGGTLADSPSIAEFTAYPPFGGTILEPNVLINLDTSTSQSYFAYDFDWNARTASGGMSRGPIMLASLSLSETLTDGSGGVMILASGGGHGGTPDPPVSKGFDPTNDYYGYFNSDKKYSYSSGEFVENTIGSWDGNFLNWLTMRRSDIIKKVLIGGKTRSRAGMAGDTHDLVGDPPYANSKYLGYQKQICVTEDGNLTSSDYTPYSDCPLTFTFDNDEGERTGGEGRRWWEVADIPAFSKGSTYTSSSDFKVVVHRDTKPEGIIQRIGDNVRWGLEVMNNGYWTTAGRMGGGGCHSGGDETGGSDGGHHSSLMDVTGGTILVPIGYDNIDDKVVDGETVRGMVTEIAAAGPYTPSTPIAESLWTATGYFQQYETQSNYGPRYFTGETDRGRWGRGGHWGPRSAAASYPTGDDVDPYYYASPINKWVPCANSFVITLTDGEPTADEHIDTTALSDAFNTNYTDGTSPLPTWRDETNNYFWALDGSHYVDEVAFYGHVDDDTSYRDLRTGTDGTKAIPGDDATKWQQNLTHYFIYANFGGGTPNGERLLNWSGVSGGGAARNGAFKDGDGDFVPDQQNEYDADGDGNNDTFYEAENGYQLEAALLKALYDIIYNSKKSGTASAIVGTRGGDGTIYQAYFYPGITNSTDGERRWLGYLQALSVDADGNLTQLWEAGKKLWERDLSTNPRTIYTTTDGSSFLSGNFTTSNASNLKDYLRAGSDEAEAIIEYITGEDDSPTVNGTTYNYRPRTVTIDATTNIWKLGDIVYSSPTPVEAPMERYDKYYADTTYATFYNKYKSRSTVVYAGANDGMLHAFNGSTGEEQWAFIPKQLLPHLKWLTDMNYAHVYYMDLKPKVTDAQIFTTETECATDINDSACVHPDGWGTILIGGMRFGGKHIQWTSGGSDYETFSAYFALDITDSSNPRLLWTFTDSNLGFTTSYPAIARVKGSSTDRWVMIVGSGPDEFDGGSNVSSTRTGKVFVVDLGTGSLLKTFDLGTLTLNTNNTFMADPIAIDVSLDYKVDVAYIGDADGNMYRLVTKNSTDVADWTLSTLISTSGNKLITSAPSAALDGNRNMWVYFGTGKFIGSDDKLTTDVQAFYGVKDVCKPWTPDSNGDYPSCSGSSYTVTDDSTDLYNASQVEVCEDGEVDDCDANADTWTEITTAAGASAIKGWKINFPSISGHTSFTGERSLSKPLVVGGLVIFTTYIPEDELCSTEEGDAYLWAVYYKTGTAYKERVFDETTGPVKREGSLDDGFATVTAAVTTDGVLRIFASTLLGETFKVEMDTPLNLTSGIKGWSPQCGE